MKLVKASLSKLSFSSEEDSKKLTRVNSAENKEVSPLIIRHKKLTKSSSDLGKHSNEKTDLSHDEDFGGYLKGVYAEENFAFLQEVEKYKKIEDFESRKFQGEKIIHKFFHPICILNIDYSLLLSIKNTVELEEYPLSLFDEAEKSITQILELIYRMRYLAEK